MIELWESTNLDLKSIGGQELVDLQQKKRGFGEEHSLGIDLCVLSPTFF